MMMMMAILIWYGLGVQGQHVYRALKRTWELFTVLEMAMGCVYLCFSTPRADCLRQWKDGWDLFTSMFDVWGNLRAQLETRLGGLANTSVTL